MFSHFAKEWTKLPSTQKNLPDSRSRARERARVWKISSTYIKNGTQHSATRSFTLQLHFVNWVAFTIFAFFYFLLFISLISLVDHVSFSGTVLSSSLFTALLFVNIANYDTYTFTFLKGKRNGFGLHFFLRRLIIRKLHNRIVHIRHTDIMIKSCGGRKISATMKMAIE